MSDGTQSPLIQTKIGTKHAKTINLEAKKPIKMVKASDYKGSFVYNVKFEDKDGNLVEEYNPMRYFEANEVQHAIAENEQIIGFYGSFDSADNSNFFARFGFIVKVKEN